jgi:hypothetical protein
LGFLNEKRTRNGKMGWERETETGAGTGDVLDPSNAGYPLLFMRGAGMLFMLSHHAQPVYNMLGNAVDWHVFWHDFGKYQMS